MAHVPFRQCVACRVRAPQSSLVRFVHASGAWRLDAGAPRAAGRGAYLCSERCAERIGKHKRFGGLAVAARAVAWTDARGLSE